uniref:Mitochondrial 3' processome subunit 1 n=1 Tax=Trypanosoma brucei brucei TaxID=5702 RepID=MPSS1_TRYBB|nr:RecName: Full=Mitochondrial 3' processome subunit 1; Flags: Precursor [Trypanosoma brucei brucei]AME15290.1 mitochondrial 3' processome subunit 1 [Trypanosoma brucei]
MRRLILSQTLRVAGRHRPPVAMFLQRFYRGHGISTALPLHYSKRHRKREGRMYGKPLRPVSDGENGASGDGGVLTRWEAVVSSRHQCESPVQTLAKSEKPKKAENTVAGKMTGSSRFSHRRDHSAYPSGVQPAPLATSGLPTQSSERQQQKQIGQQQVPLDALHRLFKVHAVMRTNYEALGKCTKVLKSFSTACAEALLQLGVLQKEQPSAMERKGFIDVQLCKSRVTEASKNGTSSPCFVLPPESPLYRTTIKFPTITVEHVLTTTVPAGCGAKDSGGDIMSVDMEGAAPFPMGHCESRPSTSAGNGVTVEYDCEGDVLSHGAAWNSIIEGFGQLALNLKQNASVSDFAQLAETLAYFKWVKDEEQVGWGTEDCVVKKFREAMANAKDTSASGSDPNTSDVSAALAAIAESFLRKIPRVDCIGSAVVHRGGERTAPSVHAIDVMLNLALRMCLSQWHAMSHFERMNIVLFCTYPWFAEDLSIAAGLCLTQSYLQSLLRADADVTYQHTFHYVRRVSRLCWPCIHDTDSAPVKKLLFPRDPQGTAVSSHALEAVSVEEKDNQLNQKEGLQGEEQATTTSESKLMWLPSFKDASCVSYGSSMKQRAAYELLLLWMTCVNPSGLHRSSPHGRYVSATGIAIIDVDLFVTQRFRTGKSKDEWLLLHPVEGDVVASVTIRTMVQHCETPYALTRLFFCNFHSVLPHIWGGIGARRREIIWTAWCRAVAQPLVNTLSGSDEGQREDDGGMQTLQITVDNADRTLDYLKPLISALTSDELFLRLIMRCADKSLEEMACEIGSGNNTLPLSKWCAQLAGFVYSVAFALHCRAKREGCNRDGGPSRPNTATDSANKKVVSGKQTDNLPKGTQEDISDLQLQFKAAVSALLRKLSAGDTQVAEQLLHHFYEPHFSGDQEREVVEDIQRHLQQVCDSQSRDALHAWIECSARASCEATVPLKEELLCKWQRTVLEADAGLPVVLPTIVECCRGLVGLVKKRGRNISGRRQGQQRGTESTTVGEESSCKEVFSKEELPVVITVLSRAMLTRTSTVSTVGLTKISSEISTLLSSCGYETADGNTSGGGRNGRELCDTNTATITSATAGERTVELELILSGEIDQKAGELPWITILEAVQLQLVPYTVVKNLLTSFKGGCDNGKERLRWQELQRDFQRKRHHRLVGNTLVFRWYGCAVPNDEGWEDGSGLMRPMAEDRDNVHSASHQGRTSTELGAFTRRLLKTLARAEVTRLDDRKEITTQTFVVGPSDDSATRHPTPGQEEDANLQRLDLLFRVHTLAAHILMTASTKKPHMIHELYDTLLHLVERVMPTTPNAPGNASDLLLLWLVGSAVAVGLRFRPNFLIKWPSTPEVSSGNLKSCPSAEEKTVHILRDIEPYLQSELLRPTVRLRFVINVLVALRSLELLGARIDVEGLHMDQLLVRASADRRLLSRHVNLFLIGCSALQSTQSSILHTALHLREAKYNLSFAEIERAFVAIALSADTFARQHEALMEQNYQQQQNRTLSVTVAANNTTPALRVSPVQLRHAWSALGRRVLENAGESPTDLFVRGLQCAAAVGCIDSALYQQLLSYVVEFRWEDLHILDWVMILRTVRQSFENRRNLEAYLKEPLQAFMLTMTDSGDNSTEQSVQKVNLKNHEGEQLLEGLCLFAEALPGLFIGDRELWGLLWQALGSQWSACFNAASNIEEQQRITAWLQEINASYAWAARAAGFRGLDEPTAL